MTSRTRDPGPMSVSEESTDDDRGPQADRCMLTPLDLASELSAMVPRAIERGRGQVKLAQALTRLMIEHSPIGALPVLRRPPVDVPARPVTTPPEAGAPSRDVDANADDIDDGSGAHRPAPTAPAHEPTVPVDDLALPDYDSLSASQVIPRLQGLDPGELEDLRRYEAAGRSRRTILNKIAQLQSSS